jgi:hypothetical protein
VKLNLPVLDEVLNAAPTAELVKNQPRLFSHAFWTGAGANIGE